MDYEEELNRIEEYEKLRNKLKLERDKLGWIKALKKIPYPQHLAGGIMLLTIVIFLFSYAPVIMNFALNNWLKPGMLQQNLVTGSIITNLGLTAVLFVCFAVAGNPIKVWFKAWALKRPILFLWTDSRTLQLIVPKKIRKTIWEVDKESCIEPRADRVFIGPNKTTVANATPDSPEIIDMMEKGRGVDNWDMSRVQLYGSQKEAEARASMLTGYDHFLKFVPWIVVLVSVSLVFYPMASKRLSEQGTINQLQNEAMMYRRALIDNGINPETVLGNPPAVTNPPTTTIPNIREATTGIDIGGTIKVPGLG